MYFIITQFFPLSLSFSFEISRSVCFNCTIFRFYSLPLCLFFMISALVLLLLFRNEKKLRIKVMSLEKQQKTQSKLSLKQTRNNCIRRSKIALRINQLHKFKLHRYRFAFALVYNWSRLEKSNSSGTCLKCKWNYKIIVIRRKVRNAFTDYLCYLFFIFLNSFVTVAAPAIQ